ncbi:MAG: hypothetical protein QY323_05110 [Patescibacteria group bacterium]|nr:MAG: hypothetical protein QY323_05110 [Patescibacteria group bacterium]
MSTNLATRPFTREEKRVFDAAVELAKTNGHVRVEDAEGGRGGGVIQRVLYPFELRYDYHLTVPQNLQREAIQVWYEGALVFSAWRSTYNGQTVECVVIETGGVWRYFLRLRHERLHARR